MRNKKIDIQNYLFVKKNNITGDLIQTFGDSAKFDKVIISMDYVDKNIPELNNNIIINNNVNNNNNDNDNNNIDNVNDIDNVNNINNDNNDSIIIKNNTKIIMLKDNEKFRDDDNNIVEIETRGERLFDGIYFRVKNVAIEFQIFKLQDILLDNRGGYNKNIDYIYLCYTIDVNGNEKKKKVKELYLTYQGMLRVLFVSHNKKTLKFIKWATYTLFTIQMGTFTQKEDIVKSILGINAKVAKDVFKLDANCLPHIYLFTLGFVKDLREIMNIPACFSDDWIVCKYGYSKELARRTIEHNNTFNKIKGCDLKLKLFAYIDSEFVSQAETDVKSCMIALKAEFKYDNMDEIVILAPESMTHVEKTYTNISKQYIGNNNDIVVKLKEQFTFKEQLEINHKNEIDKLEINHKNEINKLELIFLNKEKELLHINELQKYECKEKEKELLHINELQKQKYEYELLKKDMEILKLTK